MEKICPFSGKKMACSPACALYIDPKELNEVVVNRLASLGLMPREEGICSYKHLALCSGRKIFEHSR